MNFIAVTPPYHYENEAKAISDALSGRFCRVHIRKPDSQRDEMVKLLNAIPLQLRQRISLHDHHDLAQEFGIGGIHLNSRNPIPPLGWDGIVSVSTHSPQEALQLLSDKTTAPDYVFLSPVFPSFSKPGYEPHYSFQEMAKVAGPKMYALGGVDSSRLKMLEEAGFGGAAMLTEAWRVPIDMDAFRLQFITNPVEGRSVVEGARVALEGGCRWIQLRHKDASAETLRKEGEEILRLCHEYKAVFIVDDHVQLALELGADGVHLGQNDMPVDRARRILGPGKIIGATANTYGQLAAAAANGADYAGVGPFRFTTTKKNLSPVLGLDGYKSIISRKIDAGIRIPIVAIGGITAEDIPGIMATGVDGIAASGVITNAGNPAVTTGEILNTINNSVTISN